MIKIIKNVDNSFDDHPMSRQSLLHLVYEVVKNDLQ